MSETEGKVFIGGLSQETTTESLEEYFSAYGEILDGVVMMDQQTKRSRGFGFITFVDSSVVPAVLAEKHIIHNKQVECKKACPKEQINNNNKSVGNTNRSSMNSNLNYNNNYRYNNNNSNVANPYGNVVNVNQCQYSSNSNSSSSQRGQYLNNSNSSTYYRTEKIFVGGLPDMSTEEFKRYFSKYGTVVDAVVMNNKASGRPRGFGFITYASADSVDEALRRSPDHYLKGKHVEVKRAMPKDDNNSHRHNVGPPLNTSSDHPHHFGCNNNYYQNQNNYDKNFVLGGGNNGNGVSGNSGKQIIGGDGGIMNHNNSGNIGHQFVPMSSGNSSGSNNNYYCEDNPNISDNVSSSNSPSYNPNIEMNMGYNRDYYHENNSSYSSINCSQQQQRYYHQQHPHYMMPSSSYHDVDNEFNMRNAYETDSNYNCNNLNNNYYMGSENSADGYYYNDMSNKLSSCSNYFANENNNDKGNIVGRGHHQNRYSVPPDYVQYSGVSTIPSASYGMYNNGRNNVNNRCSSMIMEKQMNHHNVNASNNVMSSCFPSSNVLSSSLSSNGATLISGGDVRKSPNLSSLQENYYVEKDAYYCHSEGGGSSYISPGSVSLVGAVGIGSPDGVSVPSSESNFIGNNDNMMMNCSYSNNVNCGIGSTGAKNFENYSQYDNTNSDGSNYNGAYFHYENSGNVNYGTQHPSSSNFKSGYHHRGYNNNDNSYKIHEGANRNVVGNKGSTVVINENFDDSSSKNVNSGIGNGKDKDSKRFKSGTSTKVSNDPIPLNMSSPKTVDNDDLKYTSQRSELADDCSDADDTNNTQLNDGESRSTNHISSTSKTSLGVNSPYKAQRTGGNRTVHNTRSHPY